MILLFLQDQVLGPGVRQQGSCSAAGANREQEKGAEGAGESSAAAEH